MHAAALECVGVCFLTEALGGGLTGEVTPSQRSFEGNCVKFHRHATICAHFELPWMYISTFSQSLWRKRFFCFSQDFEDIWYLRSKVNFPHTCFFWVVISDSGNLYEMTMQASLQLNFIGGC